jgi:hypothetical protein
VSAWPGLGRKAGGMSALAWVLALVGLALSMAAAGMPGDQPWLSVTGGALVGLGLIVSYEAGARGR